MPPDAPPTPAPAPRATAAADAAVHVLGVRHHGPGSARSLARALEAIGPDAVLVEGPPDADPLIPLLGHPAMEPPVALLVYRPDQPRVSAYYPFAAFSPERQAIVHALERGVPVRFMDLPVAHQFGLAEQEESRAAEAGPPADDAEADPEPDGDSAEDVARRVRVDPLQVLAEAAGFDDGERWWEHVVEHRRDDDGTGLFAAIGAAMAAVREHAPPAADPREELREAHMRQTIRAARAAGHRRIAVVCGAWHAPALRPDCWPPARDDAARLKGLPRAKVAATWVPWTHGRLAAESGYGAGVRSPGWYHHLWTAPDQVVGRWLTRVARLLRGEGLDASPATVVEGVRLAEALAALRGRPLPGLDELNEVCRTVFCFGDDAPMRLIRRTLVVGEALGRVPPETPSVPLQQDLERLQKSLRLPPDPAQTTRVLDLREPTDLARSRLLHRLALLGVPWGREAQASGKGTFKEGWQLQWHPEFAVALIEAGAWGVTVLDAATTRARDLADAAGGLPELTDLLGRAILADLAEAVAHVMRRVEDRAAAAGDVTQLMAALPALANLLRYGNVRKTDATMVGHAFGGMVARVCVGLPLACASLDDGAAAAMFDAIRSADAAIRLAGDDDRLAPWHEALARLAGSDLLHQLVAGRCCRILLDAGVLDAGEASRRMGLAVSTAVEPTRAAAWVEGFLKGSGELLCHDDALFGILDGWLAGLPDETFRLALPVLRRTFSEFDAPLRRNLGEKARDLGAARPAGGARGGANAAGFDAGRAAAVLPLLARLLGPIPPPQSPTGRPEANP